MKTIEQEATDYGNSFGYNENNIQEQLAAEYGFIAGYNSKNTKAKVLQAQIDVLEPYLEWNEEFSYSVREDINRLQQQLKELYVGKNN
jgi:hypothetical protein